MKTVAIQNECFRQKLIDAANAIIKTTGTNAILYVTILVIYLSMFLNNVLLTTVVPTPTFISFVVVFYRSMKKMLPPETEKAALLLSSKSVIQLAVNPLVAVLISRIGYYVSLLIGNIILLVTSLVFAFGNSFAVLVFCRGLHGIASVIITVSGLCICAKIFCHDESSRSKYMGIILSSEALGVLIGYSFGAFTYNLVGKSTPFVVIGLIILVNIALLIFCEGLIINAQGNVDCQIGASHSKWCHLIGDSFILTILGAVFVSSSTVAILEPCLPYWLMENIELQNWQTGFIFLPDSFGYLLSTSTCGVIAYKMGRWKITVIALILIGTCSIMIPNTRSLLGLSLPHFGVGFGIGAIDSALIPLLANYVDSQQDIQYGLVYALQQVITSIAYVCGAFFGGELMQIIGFSSVMSIVGILNITYSVAFVIYGRKHSLMDTKVLPYEPAHQQIELMTIKNARNYHSFRNQDSD